LSRQLYHCIGKIKPSGIKELDSVSFSNGLEEIILFGLNLTCINHKKRRYIIELHVYNPFSMIKFYPACAKYNSRKYELRGKHEIGFTISKKTFLEMVYQCALIMKNHLDNNPNKFVGYIGQTDKIDLIRNKKTSQRSDVYNIITSSLFDPSKYQHATKEIFQEINLRLFRKIHEENQHELTKKQHENYNQILTIFEENSELLYELMTPLTRARF
jgi:hypothetical protein